MLRRSRRELIRFLLTTNRVLEKKVDLLDLPRGLWKVIDWTLRMVPLDPALLMNQHVRTKHLNRQLAWCLAFVAGAVNAGGFLALHAYTSHVTGAVSRAADEVASGNTTGALAALSAIACFALGAFCSATLISLGRHLRYKSIYALALLIEAGLLLVFGLLGGSLQHIHKFFLPVTLILLAFIMGMQNAMVTTISAAEVRTTHMTGIVTDLGIELSRMIFRWDHKPEHRKANRDRLKLHGIILASFFGGALTGALGFRHVGFKVTVFLAGLLFFLASRPIIHDLRVRWRLMQQG